MKTGDDFREPGKLNEYYAEVGLDDYRDLLIFILGVIVFAVVVSQ